jgi:hypothetical protein
MRTHWRIRFPFTVTYAPARHGSMGTRKGTCEKAPDIAKKSDRTSTGPHVHPCTKLRQSVVWGLGCQRNRVRELNEKHALLTEPHSLSLILNESPSRTRRTSSVKSVWQYERKTHRNPQRASGPLSGGVQSIHEISQGIFPVPSAKRGLGVMASICKEDLLSLQSHL